MKNWRHYTFASIMVVCVLFLAFGCTGNSLNGTYETNQTNTWIGRTIEFSGDRFTISGNRGGTYSIVNDRIEFVFDTGDTTGTSTGSFSRSGKNITINGTIFTRK